jgi:sugar phosphate isomerase/epimerase
MATKFACSTACFRHASIDAVLEEIRRAGFRAIDLSLLPGGCDHFDATRQPAVERQDFVAFIRNSRLLVPTVTAAPGNFNSPSDRFEFIVQSALAHLKLAAQLSGEGLNVTCGVPAVGRERFRAEALVQAQGLKQIAREAAQLGLHVNVWAPHRDGLCRNLDEARFLLEQINEDNVRLLLDLAQLQSAGVTPAEAVRALAGRIGHVRLADCAGVELPAFFEGLERAGFDGYCALEPNLGEDLAVASRRLWLALRSIWACLAGPAEAPVGAGDSSPGGPR